MVAPKESIPMTLLDGSDVRLQVAEGGLVTIDPL
jgi:hypothetical protein